MEPISGSKTSTDQAASIAFVQPLPESALPDDAPWPNLYRYWRSKHKKGRPPALRDLDPLIEIPRIVSNIIVLDILADGYKFRIAGSEHRHRLGFEMTGNRVGSVGDLPKPIKSGWIAAYDLVRQDRKPRIISSRMRAGAEAKHALVVMPLVREDNEIDNLLVGAFYEGDFKQGSVIEGLIIQEIQM